MGIDESQDMSCGPGKSDSPSFHNEKELKTSGADRFYTVEEIRDRLSISTYAFWAYRPVGPNVLQELADHGIGKIELAESREQFDTADAGSMKLFGKSARGLLSATNRHAARSGRCGVGITCPDGQPDGGQVL